MVMDIIGGMRPSEFDILVSDVDEQTEVKNEIARRLGVVYLDKAEHGFPTSPFPAKVEDRSPLVL